MLFNSNKQADKTTIMGKKAELKQECKRSTKKNKKKNTMNKYGKFTNRHIRMSQKPEKDAKKKLKEVSKQIKSKK